MTIANASFDIGGSISVTGGTATGVVSLGNTQDKHPVILDDASTYQNHTGIEFAVKRPRVSDTAPNGYTQMRNTVVIRIPLLLDNGKYTTNTVRIEMSTDPETTSSERGTLQQLAAFICSDADLDQFWHDQACG